MEAVPTGATGRALSRCASRAKGQVTLPQDVRRRLGTEPGSEVDFEIHDEVVQLVRRSVGEGTALVATMRGRGTSSMSTDEIMALTRGET